MPDHDLIKLRLSLMGRPVRNYTFEDVTDRAGVADTVGWKSGVTMADVNGDGKLDLFLTRGSAPPALYINHGKAGFRNEAAARGVAGDGTPEYGAVFADYDNDGRPDLYITRHGTDVLYHNVGGGRFKDVTASAGVGAGYSRRTDPPGTTVTFAGGRP